MIYSVGQILDREFRIVAIHKGGMAIVYIVEDTETGKRAAAKTIREEFLNDPSLVARFRREMKIWVGMGDHPNVVRAFFVKNIQSYPFLFMEYLDGGSIFDLLKETRSLPLDQILRIAKGIAEGMNHVHNRITPDGLRGILHRDLKPANVLLGKKQEIKVADFGLARALDTTRLTQTYDVVGTIHYSSPEQILDSRNVDKRTDIYSFGAILYHMTCGEYPFVADTWSDLVNEIRTVMPPPPAELREDIPETLSQMIMKCLAKRKEDRFENFADLCDNVSELLRKTGGGTAPPDETEGRELHDILGMAELEAAQSGSPSVEPTHLLLAAVLSQTEPLSSWFREMQIDEDEFISHFRNLIEGIDKESAATKTKFRRSSRRVIGLAHTFAGQDGLTTPQGRHMLKALFREPSARDIMINVLNLVRAEVNEVEEFFDEIEGLFD
jgi:serine/threonine protein kinase